MRERSAGSCRAAFPPPCATHSASIARGLHKLGPARTYTHAGRRGLLAGTLPLAESGRAGRRPRPPRTARGTGRPPSQRGGRRPGPRLRGRGRVRARAGRAQLEGPVERVLLLRRAVHHRPPAQHPEAAVAQVGRVQPAALQHQDAHRRGALRSRARRAGPLPSSLPSSIRMHTVAEPCTAARSALDRGAGAGRGGRRRAAGPSLAHRARALRRPPWALAHAGTDVHVLRAGHWDPHVLPWERKPAHGAWGRPLERTGIRRRSNSAPSAVCVAPLRHMCLLLCHPAACCCAGRGTGLRRLAERTWRPPIGQGTEKMHIAPQLTICEHAPARGSCCARRA